MWFGVMSPSVRHCRAQASLAGSKRGFFVFHFFYSIWHKIISVLGQEEAEGSSCHQTRQKSSTCLPKMSELVVSPFSK